MASKAIIIGLDGATLDLIRPWAKEGRLPGFARLMREGVHGPLASTPNQRSAAAWTSLMTGQNPGKHGIYEFYEYVPGTYDIRFLNGGDRDAESLWGILSRQGRRVVVINVPMTYPAEAVNGVLIAGLDAPGADSPGFMHPPELESELRERFGTYILEPGITGLIVRGDVDGAIALLKRELDQKVKVSRHLMATLSWDLFFVVFRSLDAVQHCFWKYMDPAHPDYHRPGSDRYREIIFDVYRRVDDYLMKIMDGALEDTALMVVSDHGFGSKHGATQAINDWLAEQGYLVYSDRSRTALRAATTRLLAGIYRRVVGHTSRRLKERLVKLFPSLREKVQARLIFSGIDWEHTKAYSDTLFPNIRINLRGREPLGIVAEQEYNDLVERLKGDISELRDAESGEPIVDTVFQRDEIYHGPHTALAPDLLIRWREDVPITSISLKKHQLKPDESRTLIPGEDPSVISGDHRLHGVFFLRGHGIRQSHSLANPEIIDVTPTVLYLMGCPIPQNIDGRVIAEAFAPGRLDAHPPPLEKGGPPSGHSARRDYTEEDHEAVASRLRDLGYLE